MGEQGSDAGRDPRLERLRQSSAARLRRIRERGGSGPIEDDRKKPPGAVSSESSQESVDADTAGRTQSGTGGTDSGATVDNQSLPAVFSEQRSETFQTRQAPATQVNPVGIRIEAMSPCYCAAMRAGLPMLRNLQITNQQATALQDVQVSVEVGPEGRGKGFACTIDQITTGGTQTIEVVSTVIDMEPSDWLKTTQDLMVRIAVSASGRLLRQLTFSLRLEPLRWVFLSPDHYWAFAATVCPQSDDLLPVMADWSAAIPGRNLAGYLTRSPDEQTARRNLRGVLSALWNVLQKKLLGYAPPPPGLPPWGQRVRTSAEMFVGRVATCLDYSVLLAAVLEKAGLEPVLMIIPGHAMVGCWLLSREQRRALGRLQPEVMQQWPTVAEFRQWSRQQPDLLVLDAVALASHSPQEDPFRDAEENVGKRLEKMENIDARGLSKQPAGVRSHPAVILLDLCSARRAGMMPLPE